MVATRFNDLIQGTLRVHNSNVTVVSRHATTARLAFAFSQKRQSKMLFRYQANANAIPNCTVKESRDLVF